ncbi:MAG: hypothetical protein BGP24_14215 [Lysobacterales bacterium 69-70]|nr:hypothetical protein [Xanthomonadaceae bacterium]ODU35245.1 MAG: hypothetical protein ABS97_05050 [Xanthomonadaceae bacterium SCN 69-320]ODV17287.1 MAG: hypothetical protein ABT27_18190 [Xanthomonadaceae bacterium SCN 69-25]OJY94145.1 MAG: hypothetical protein BGP24_14215 [Xanthomonadales bacterium 69-70]
MDIHRRRHLEKLGLSARWLDRPKAASADAYAAKFYSSQHYGLEPETVAGIEHHDVHSPSIARAWLAERFPDSGTVQIVFGRRSVCVLDSAVFLENWRNLFLPARDDVFVLHNLSRKVFFYCHEDELEVGERRF